jgi:hypothetical protein
LAISVIGIRLRPADVLILALLSSERDQAQLFLN